MGIRLGALLVLVVALAACVSAPPERGAREMSEDVLYVNLLWHQHQPLYFKDPDTGVYSRPWVRVHATKSYYDMAAILRDYPEVRATFNLTPVLLRQLEDYTNGAKDIYWVLAEKHPSELTDSEKQFILERFFDANHDNLIGKFPKYTELLERRAAIDTRTLEGLAAFSEQDYMDLQVFFNLVWFDPSFLEEEPLASLVAKGGNFEQSDKAIIFAQARRVISRVVDVHRELQDAGQIEVITTPYAHPILPLIFNTRLAATGDPTAELPAEFYYPGDAVAHLERSVEIYRENFGRDPRGLWPAEGSVAQEIVKMVGDAGYQWMASGEQVLAKSLGLEGFVRDATDTVTNADALYRPYIVQPSRGEPVTIVFRDLRLSDLIGFEYSGTPGRAAAADLMARLERIRQRLIEETGDSGGPHLVSIILDGENAWEHYPNDGRVFLNALYEMLSESETVQTTTVPEFMEAFPEQRAIEDLWPGSWFSSDFSTWIGEREETKAWNMLGQVRNFLALYDQRGRRETTPERLELALDYMYLAEGSDWFWWYGSDQESGNDEYFDRAYRELLANVFRALGEPVPDYVNVPIIPARPAPPAKRPMALFTPEMDGSIGQDWESGGYYRATGSAQARASDLLDRLSYGFDAESLHIGVEAATDLEAALRAGPLQLYLAYPGQGAVSPFVDGTGSSLVGFDASLYIELGPDGLSLNRFTGDDWEAVDHEVAWRIDGRSSELRIPLATFGDMESGDEFRFALFRVEASGVTDQLPSDGPGRANVPELGGGRVVFAVEDPAQDDHGPGSYTYPTDSVFTPGSYDIRRFVVEEEERYYKFTVDVNAPIQNPWGSGINLSIQTFDIYIDTDPGAGTGARKLLEGRNAAMPAEYGWEYALWVEGWNQKIMIPADPTDRESAPVEMSGAPLRVRVDSDNGRVIIRVPRESLSLDLPLENYGYTVALLGQDGFPSAGVRRVRDVNPTSAQWRAGGAPDDINHTRILDMAVPAGVFPTQEELLSDYASVSGGSRDDLTADDLPVAHVIVVE